MSLTNIKNWNEILMEKITEIVNFFKLNSFSKLEYFVLIGKVGKFFNLRTVSSFIINCFVSHSI